MCEILAVSSRANSHEDSFVEDEYCLAFKFEADRRCFTITINSFGTELSKDDRVNLYPTCGKLYPYGIAGLTRASDYDQVRMVAENFAEYKKIFDDIGTQGQGGEKTLEDKFFQYEVGISLSDL